MWVVTGRAWYDKIRYNAVPLPVGYFDTEEDAYNWVELADLTVDNIEVEFILDEKNYLRPTSLVSELTEYGQSLSRNPGNRISTPAERSAAAALGHSRLTPEQRSARARKGQETIRRMNL